mmetsp:Transcript_23113/g.64499  ORF Transcript_23113/g.64499 Transcript_23113/m.64499 type:complete len:301 (+) Transcript_23113:247-1149(+)
MQARPSHEDGEEPGKKPVGLDTTSAQVGSHSAERQRHDGIQLNECVSLQSIAVGGILQGDENPAHAGQPGVPRQTRRHHEGIEGRRRVLEDLHKLGGLEDDHEGSRDGVDGGDRVLDLEEAEEIRLEQVEGLAEDVRRGAAFLVPTLHTVRRALDAVDDGEHGRDEHELGCFVQEAAHDEIDNAGLSQHEVESLVGGTGQPIEAGRAAHDVGQRRVQDGSRREVSHEGDRGHGFACGSSRGDQRDEVEEHDGQVSDHEADLAVLHLLLHGIGVLAHGHRHVAVGVGGSHDGGHLLVLDLG